MSFLHTCLGNRYEDGVESGFINYCIEGGFGEIHRTNIHEKILKSFRFFFVLILHGLDADVGDIDVGNLGISFLEHFLAEPGVARADIEDTVSLIHMGGDDVLEAAEPLVPVEGLRVSR